MQSDSRSCSSCESTSKQESLILLSDSISIIADQEHQPSGALLESESHSCRIRLSRVAYHIVKNYRNLNRSKPGYERNLGPLQNRLHRFSLCSKYSGNILRNVSN